MTKTASQWRNSLSTCKSREYKGHRSKVHSLGWSCNGNKLASASTDHAIRIWSLERLLGRDPVSSNELTGHTGSVEQLAWSPVDEHLLASVSTDRTVRFWDASAAANAALVATIPTASENINLAWSRDGRLLAVGAKDDSICIIDVSVRRIVTRTGFGPVEINEIAWSVAGDELFLTRGSGVIDIIAVEVSETGSGLGVTMGLKQTVAGHTANCYCIRFTPDGRHFAVGGADAIVTLWETLSLACTRTLCRLDWPIRTVSFSGTGELVAVGSEDSFIDVAMRETGEGVARIATTAAVNTLAWHPQKPILAYAGDNVDARSGRHTGTIFLYCS